MTDTPETHYARSADGTNLAYQVGGVGPLDLMCVIVGPFPIDVLLEDPGFVRLRRRLDSFSRTLWFDFRGMGASEGDPRDSLAGAIMDADLIALLDAVGFHQPVMLGATTHGSAAVHFAVTHPQRVSALVLFNTYAHYVREDDYPWSPSIGTSKSTPRRAGPSTIWKSVRSWTQS
jgi:pimeloyl-ACP methyl ester carboxylesterase